MDEPSILDYLTHKGVDLRQEGNKYFCSSPFSRDSNWSFCVYPHTNSFFDWSNGFGGNVWYLMSKLENKSIRELKKQHSEHEKYKPYIKDYKIQEASKTDFDYTRYINTNAKECEEIKKYATSRCLEEGSYFCGVFFERNGDDKSALKWRRIPAVAFLHVDENLKPCGIKFRKLTDENPRFSARGKLGMYTLESHINAVRGEVKVYVVEGEANANSLTIYLKQLQKKAYILSFGAVSSCLDELPSQLKNYPITLIIDYDGNEDLYNERLKLYKHFNAEPIKLILPKGEDINSLHMKNKLYLIENLL